MSAIESVSDTSEIQEISKNHDIEGATDAETACTVSQAWFLITAQKY